MKNGSPICDKIKKEFYNGDPDDADAYLCACHHIKNKIKYF